MSLALFETYSISDEDSKDVRLHPVYSKLSVPFLMEKIATRFALDGFSLIERNEFYGEMLLSDGDYSLTFHFLNDEGPNLKIGISVYAPDKRGKTRKKLMESLALLKEIAESKNAH